MHLSGAYFHATEPTAKPPLKNREPREKYLVTRQIKSTNATNLLQAALSTQPHPPLPNTKILATLNRINRLLHLLTPMQRIQNNLLAIIPRNPAARAVVKNTHVVPPPRLGRVVEADLLEKGARGLLEIARHAAPAVDLDVGLPGADALGGDLELDALVFGLLGAEVAVGEGDGGGGGEDQGGR